MSLNKTNNSPSTAEMKVLLEEQRTNPYYGYDILFSDDKVNNQQIKLKMSNINLIKIKESLREEIEWRKKTDNLADVMSDMSSDEKREIFLL